jgi:hypothetical protein
VRGAALVIIVGGVAIGAVGCGGASEASSRAARRLQREDLAALSRALKDAEVSVDSEVAATKAAWPLVADGLPSGTTPTIAIVAAAESARKVKVPALLGEAQVASLTGPAAQLAGLFRTYLALATRGWSLVAAAIDEVKHGSPASARFARENVALYIESVYDGHFTLAQLGRKLRDAYRKLGSSAAFGATLTRGEVDALAQTYSEASDRLHPHVGVRLGS